MSTVEIGGGNLNRDGPRKPDRREGKYVRSCSGIDPRRRYGDRRLAAALARIPDPAARQELAELLEVGEPTLDDILEEIVACGAVLVAASAASLTVGRLTLPVYEIYKVGEAPHWLDGLDLLSRFELPLVVVPHWNNAEGGTHDTRFCYMGQPRFEELERLIPEDHGLIGLDEHTACILDLESQEGVGTTFRVRLPLAGVQPA